MHKTLHQDIYCLGKQWAVTGFGIQAINARLAKKFDIEASRIWEEALATPMQSERWFDPYDFEEALKLARRRSQDAPHKIRPIRMGEM
jgi:hypothetical protein